MRDYLQQGKKFNKTRRSRGKPMQHYAYASLSLSPFLWPEEQERRRISTSACGGFDSLRTSRRSQDSSYSGTESIYQPNLYFSFYGDLLRLCCLLSTTFSQSFPLNFMNTILYLSNGICAGSKYLIILGSGKSVMSKNVDVNSRIAQ